MMSPHDVDSSSETPPSAVDRVLRVVGDVRPGEGARALTLATTVFILLGSYYLLKVAREALLLAHYDAETKAYLSALQAIILIPTVELYGWLASRMDRVRLVTLATVFFASHLVVFAGLRAAGVEIGPPFFVWVGIFNVFVIAQFWAFANDVYTPGEGQRLFAVIGLGSSIGAIFGSYGADSIGASLGPTALLLVPAGLLLTSLIGIHSVERARASRTADTPAAPKPNGAGPSAVRLLFSDRYLLLIAAAWLLFNCASTIGEYVVDRVMQADIHARGATGEVAEAMVMAFKARYFLWINIGGLVLQFFATGRLMRRGGASLAIMVLPVVALGGHAIMLGLGAAVGAVLVAKVAENAVNYSIHNTGRNALFLVTSSEIKYKVKVLVDSALTRVGDVAAAGSIALGAGVIGLSTTGFVAANMVLVALFVAASFFLAREHARRHGHMAKIDT